MSSKLEKARKETLRAFLKAWSAKNLGAILDCLTEDCVYAASVGPDPGKTYEGKAAASIGIAAMLAHDKTEQASVSNLLLSGRRAVWQWRYVKRSADGEAEIDIGCDLIWFRGSKISKKDAYRKVRKSV